MEDFTPPEVRAALALAGGDHAVAAAYAKNARRHASTYLALAPARLARAVSASVRCVLQAQYRLPDTVARLVALLCGPPDALAAAAALVDCRNLAHRLLTTFTKKARSLLWTEGLAQAATVAVELLLSLGDHAPVIDAVEYANEGDLDVDLSTVMFVPTPTSAKATSERNREFNALDSLLGEAEPEGRLTGRPLVSEAGLKLNQLQSGVVTVRPIVERRRTEERSAVEDPLAIFGDVSGAAYKR